MVYIKNNITKYLLNDELTFIYLFIYLSIYLSIYLLLILVL